MILVFNFISDRRLINLSSRFSKVASLLLYFFLFFIELSSLFALGTEEQPLDLSVDPIQSLESDPIIQSFLFRDIEVKPSLSYLRSMTEAKNSLLEGDYVSALNRYLKMSENYGPLDPINFGLGESYFLLGDMTNAMLYYTSILDTQTKGGVSSYVIDSNESIFASYRIAYIYYQRNEMDNYEDTLSNIVNSSDRLDIALFSLVKSQSLDYVVSLFLVPVDYSYLARRELGVYYSFNEDYIIKKRTNKINEMFATDEEKFNSINKIESDIEKEILDNLFSALGMAVNSWVLYIKSNDPFYEFSDIAFTIETLKASDEGRMLLDSFDITKILVAIRKFYIDNSATFPDYKFFVLYCNELLESLSYFEDVNSDSIYDYHSNLQ